ncbi:MAG: GntR family transcriptional regulator, partial [bacterium]
MQTPRYQQVKNLIMEHISTGEWPVGASIPSEHELVRRYGYARMTINRALRELADEGVIQRSAGVGSFVAEQDARREHAPLLNGAALVDSLGEKLSCQVVVNKGVYADGLLAESFSKPDENTLFYSEIHYYGNGVLRLVEQRYVNPDIAPDYLKQDWMLISPTEYLLKVAPIQHLEEKLKQLKADAHLAQLFKLKRDAQL